MPAHTPTAAAHRNLADHYWMNDSTAVAVLCEDSGAGSKSAVLTRIADPRGPRWTPTAGWAFPASPAEDRRVWRIG